MDLAPVRVLRRTDRQGEGRRVAGSDIAESFKEDYKDLQAKVNLTKTMIVRDMLDVALTQSELLVRSTKIILRLERLAK